MAAMTSTPRPCSWARYLILPWPMPCSPVQVPSMRSARSVSRSRNPRTARISSWLPVSINGMTWKFPSPTWPTMGARRPVWSMSWRVSPTQAARAETGTQTSVTKISTPGRKPRAAQ